MTPATLTPTDRGRIKSALEARRIALRTEVKAQLQGSGDDRVVGLRNRLDETDDWAVADSLAELDIAGVRHALRELTEVDAALGAHARRQLRRVHRLRRAHRAGATGGLSDGHPLPRMPADARGKTGPDVDPRR